MGWGWFKGVSVGLALGNKMVLGCYASDSIRYTRCSSPARVTGWLHRYGRLWKARQKGRSYGSGINVPTHFMYTGIGPSMYEYGADEDA
ncbi:uncharacterized protein B0T15DRAFT_529669 [Chaetomium strumarium]|uniref:Uncharacterized protein n=1 Tax=Chaetomium strumarium TaxID=1170767 RepID=A0AAJ0GW84_9PEZI|nr:hypothetical protein B0T15DRAFT_529669 [Chaetomium strumarium]